MKTTIIELSLTIIAAIAILLVECKVFTIESQGSEDLYCCRRVCCALLGVLRRVDIVDEKLTDRVKTSQKRAAIRKKERESATVQ